MTTPTPLADRIRLCKGLTSRKDLARDLDQLSSDCADLERELAALREKLRQVSGARDYWTDQALRAGDAALVKRVNPTCGTTGSGYE